MRSRPITLGMNRVVAALIALFAMIAVPAQARMVVTEITTTETVIIDGVETTTITTEITEEWVDDDAASHGANSRLVDVALPADIGANGYYGPFRVIDEHRAALVSLTDSYSPAAFRRLLADHPGIKTLEMHDCPGTHDDRANLAIGRMIREAGIATHVPSFGSVRSGAVELFLAGAQRRIDEGASFAVHAWMDELGYQAHDYGAQHPQNAKYLAYYQEMGMTRDQASAFYAMTNSVPHQQALWLNASDMRGWLAQQSDKPSVDAASQSAPQIAYAGLGNLDLGTALN